MHIFNFHHIESEPLKHLSRKDITITPDGMTRFIRMARKVGLEIVSLREAIEMRLFQEHPSRHARKLIITFDDGCENFHTYGLSVFEKEKCPVTMFVLPGKFSGTNDWDQADLPENRRDRLMSRAQIKALAGSRFVTIGSHGMYHRRFATLPPEELRCEIHESHEILHEMLGDELLPVLAYPWGNYNADVCRVMADSPYKYAMTTDKGQWMSTSGVYEIPRHTGLYRDGNSALLLMKLLKNKIGYFDAFSRRAVSAAQGKLPA